MKSYIKYLSALFLAALLLPVAVKGQDKEVIEQLKNIEKGNIAGAGEALKALKNKYPESPSVMFLDAVLKTGGDEALQIYKTIYEKYPKNTFADAALYRIFSYYYSIGLYKKAEETLSRLKAEYPSSPYIQAADRTIPEELDGEENKAKVPKDKPIKTIPEKTEEVKFTVQAGAFLNIQNAQQLVNNLEKDGYKSEIINKEVGGSILNVVLAGRFASEKEADAILLHIDKKYHLKGRVVPVTK